MTFDALGAAAIAQRDSALIVHGKVDAYCAPELAQALYDDAAGSREIRWLDRHPAHRPLRVEPYVTRRSPRPPTFSAAT